METANTSEMCLPHFESPFVTHDAATNVSNAPKYAHLQLLNVSKVAEFGCVSSHGTKNLAISYTANLLVS